MRPSHGIRMLGQQLIFSAALYLLATSCSLCHAETLLAGGSYIVRSPGEPSLIDIDQDVAAIRDSTNLTEIKDIYTNGKYAKPLTLQRLSTDAAHDYKGDPMYTFYKHAYLHIGLKEGEIAGEFDSNHIEQYADTLVKDLLEIDKENIAQEAILVNTIWMTVVFYLNGAAKSCRYPDVAEPYLYLDLAAGFYIGLGQDKGDDESGNMLYNLAEGISKDFNQDNGVSVVNEKILELLNDIKDNIIDKGLCSTHEENSYKKFRWNVGSIIGYMNVILVQRLIRHLLDGSDRDFMKMYALAILPQIRLCNPGAFEHMTTAFVGKIEKVDNPIDDVNLLQSVYSCLGITCEMVGEFRGRHDGCVDDTSFPDGAMPYASIDRDMLQIGVLMEMEAYDAALDLYNYGRNSLNDWRYITLKEFATNESVDTNVPLGQFINYNNDNEKPQMNEYITNAIKGENTFQSVTRTQREWAVKRSLQGTLSYYAIVEKVSNAVDLCGKAKKDQAALEWQRASALAIGSIGKATMTTETVYEEYFGQTLFTLANEMCDPFGTCTASGKAHIIDAWMDQEYRGLSFIENEECLELAQLVNTEVKPSLLVPIIQGLLHYAVINENQDETQSDTIFAGEALARTVVPLINKENPMEAFLVQENMEFAQGTKSVKDGSRNVFKAIASSLFGLSVDCSLIGRYGSLEYGDICENQESSPNDSGPQSEPETSHLAGKVLTGAALAIVFLSGLVLGCYRSRNYLECGKRMKGQVFCPSDNSFGP
uniref:Uncharacterized protein n=1 Tax=Ditylum brightwellii TaxID=49249 RepID=A0A7S1YQ01_9STRA